MVLRVAREERPQHLRVQAALHVLDPLVQRLDGVVGPDRHLFLRQDRPFVDLVAMAGFGTIFDQPIHDAFPNAVVNTHPSLLPDFKGWHAVEDALAAGVKVTGCTVHLATLEVDEGPILAQEPVPVFPDDTVETLHERIKDVERRLYPEVLRSLLGEDADTENPDK